MLELEWEDIAQDDLISIAVYIATDNPVAAKALRNEVEARVAGLRRQPRMYKVGRVEGTREMVVRDNYIVVLQRRRPCGHGTSCPSCRKGMAGILDSDGFLLAHAHPHIHDHKHDTIRVRRPAQRVESVT